MFKIADESVAGTVREQIDGKAHYCVFTDDEWAGRMLETAVFIDGGRGLLPPGSVSLARIRVMTTDGLVLHVFYLGVRKDCPTGRQFVEGAGKAIGRTIADQQDLIVISEDSLRMFQIIQSFADGRVSPQVAANN